VLLLPGRCPVCGGELALVEAACCECETLLRGRFERGPFAKLDASQSEFLRLFATNRGNMRELGKKLGISYPSVRARLDEIITLLQRDEAAL
jgi:hypothetical protein